MDTVTQAALGAAIGEAGFRRRLGPQATLFGALCGIFPDADVALTWIDEWSMLTQHRGATHSLALMPLWIPLFGWLGWRLWKRHGELRTWMHLAGWALVTHALLDWCTAYGTMLLWPFSMHRFALDAVSVLDPTYTLPLLLALALARLKWVPERWAIRANAGALVFSTAYLVLGFVQSQRAIELARTQLAKDRAYAPVEVRAVPTFFNVWVWRVLARDAQGHLRLGFVSTWSPRPMTWIELPRPVEPDAARLVRTVLESPRGRDFEWFAQGMLSTRVERRVDGSTVELLDQRLGLVTRSADPPFRLIATLDAGDRILSVARERRSGPLEPRRELALLWGLWWGRDDAYAELGALVKPTMAVGP
ncbi:MAG: metal-dependent hydrolase [Planctomycetes bacterium]|nr:metal-dependent hydrolase [Planctomycetota bacterium]